MTVTGSPMSIFSPIGSLPPNSFDRRLADQRDRRRRRGRRSHRSHGLCISLTPDVLQVAGRNRIEFRADSLFRRLRWLADHREARLRVAAAKREREQHRRLRGDRIRLQPLEHAHVERALRRLVEARERQHQLDGHDFGGAEARIDRSQPRETREHQAGADQQHERERDLRDDHDVAHAGARRAGCVRRP